MIQVDVDKCMDKKTFNLEILDEDEIHRLLSSSHLDAIRIPLEDCDCDCDWNVDTGDDSCNEDCWRTSFGESSTQ